MKNKKAFYLLLSILILLIVPFFLLSFYVHPSADDFILVHQVKECGRWGYQQYLYFNWAGRYFANFIFSFNPLTFDSFIGYKISDFVMLAAFAASAFYFIFIIFKDRLDGYTKTVASLLLILLYLNVIPSLSETIYWLTGATEYFVPCILSLIFLAEIVAGLRNMDHRLKHVIAAGFLGFCICGCNEIYVIFLLELLGLIVIFNFKDRNILKFILPVFAVVLLSSLLTLMAPGNYLRMRNYSNANNIFYSIKESVFLELKLIGIHFRSPAFIIVSIMSLPFLSLMKDKGQKLLIKINPWLACLLGIFIFISFFFPVTYSIGLPAPMRVFNTISILFIIAWFYLIYLFICHYNIKIQIPEFIRNLLLIATIIFIITDFYKEPGKQISFSGNVSKAFYDLVFDASAYNAELNKRYETITNDKAKGLTNIVVPKLTVKPSSIYFVDIFPDSTYWINVGTAQYFGINSIRIK